MKKSDAVQLFGSAVNMGKQIGVTHQAVYKAPEELPRSMDRRVRKTLADFLARSGAARVAVLAFLAGVMLQAWPADAAPRTFTWVNPTQWDDSSAVTAGQITRFRIECAGTGGTTAPPVLFVPAASPLQTQHVAELPPGSYSCFMRVVAKKTATSEEASSGNSATVTFTVPVPVIRPRAATAFSVRE